MKTYDALVKECNALIPRDVIAQREGGMGRKLDYLPGFYVINRLNEVLGQGMWAYTSEATLVHTGTVKDRYGADVHSVHYLAKVRLVVTLEGKSTEFTDYGYGDGTDKVNIGKAHELAVKEAVTDALKRAARCLGNSFGNGLYDKSGEGIDDGAPAPAKPKEPAKAEPVQAEVSSKPQAKTRAEAKRGVLQKQIEGVVAVLVAAGKPIDELKAILKDKYGVTSSGELDDKQALELFTELKGLLPNKEQK